MESGPTPDGELDLHQDLLHQHRHWTAQRIGWAVMLALVLAALAGAFGHGPLSHAIADDPSLPFWVEYERIGRYQSPLPLRIHLKEDSDPDGTFLLWMSHEYLRHAHIQTITPPPSTTRLSSDGIIYTFQRQHPGQGGEIAIVVEAQGFGLLPGRVGLTGARSIGFEQWIFP